MTRATRSSTSTPPRTPPTWTSAQANERNRARPAGRYLKRIQYGNVSSRLIEPDLSQATWLFDVVFDYDEDHCEEVALDAGPAAPTSSTGSSGLSSAGQPWTVRPDPFSSYRAGFEVRTIAAAGGC